MTIFYHHETNRLWAVVENDPVPLADRVTLVWTRLGNGLLIHKSSYRDISLKLRIEHMMARGFELVPEDTDMHTKLRLCVQQYLMWQTLTKA